MLFSAIFKVKNSPLVQLYSQSIEKISKLKSKKILVNEKAIRFAHIIGTIFSGICIIALLFRENIGWGIVFIFAIIKTIRAIIRLIAIPSARARRSGLVKDSRARTGSVLG